jgi:CRP-like cAMP-binding protein
MSDLYFGINMQKLLRLGALDPAPTADPSNLPSDKLSSEEHLFCRLWSSDMMRSHIFNKGAQLMVAGQAVKDAMVIFQGQAIARCGDTEFHLGPGAVVGLAEGLAGQASKWSVTSDSVVHTRSIPIAQALDEIAKTHPGLRSLAQVTIARILGQDLKTGLSA